MFFLRPIADFLAFRARAAELSRRIEEGRLTGAELEAAVSSLLLAPMAKAPQPAPRMTAKTAAA